MYVCHQVIHISRLQACLPQVPGWHNEDDEHPGLCTRYYCAVCVGAMRMHTCHRRHGMQTWEIPRTLFTYSRHCMCCPGAQCMLSNNTYYMCHSRPVTVPTDDSPRCDYPTCNPAGERATSIRSDLACQPWVWWAAMTICNDNLKSVKLDKLWATQ